MFRGSVRVLATHSIRQFLLHFPSRASLCAIRFQLDSIYNFLLQMNHQCVLNTGALDAGQLGLITYSAAYGIGRL
jgi:hypothetical protein